MTKAQRKKAKQLRALAQEEKRENTLTKKELKRLTIIEVADAIFMLLDKDVEELERIRDSSQHSALTIWFASVAVKGIKDGDMFTLDALLNRCIGRVKEKLELTGADGGPIKTQELSPAERRAEIERMRKLRMALGDD